MSDQNQPAFNALNAEIADYLEGILGVTARYGLKVTNITLVARDFKNENSTILVTDESTKETLSEAFDWALTKTNLK